MITSETLFHTYTKACYVKDRAALERTPGWCYPCYLVTSEDERFNGNWYPEGRFEHGEEQWY